jgi:hypothetical protein
MPWWKLALYVSLAWVLFLVLVSVGMLWYISAHPMGPSVDEAREEKTGELVGMLFAGGLVPIWVLSFFWNRKNKKGPKS